LSRLPNLDRQQQQHPLQQQPLLRRLPQWARLAAALRLTALLLRLVVVWMVAVRLLLRLRCQHLQSLHGIMGVMGRLTCMLRSSLAAAASVSSCEAAVG
jgi:hypothetical protein